MHQRSTHAAPSRFAPRPWRRVGLALALLAGLAGQAAAVTVSPTALYLSPRNPSAILTLLNNGTRPEEIEIRFGFGYAMSDSTGEVRVDILDSARAGEPAATNWLRAFPRRLVLQPGQRQVVRVTVVPPAGLADGEYWGRVLVKSRGGEPPIEQVQGQVRMQLTLETTFATAVFYQRGEMTTGVSVPTATAERVVRDGVEAVQLTMRMERTGNAAFLGRLRATVVDSMGTEWSGVEDVVAVYRGLTRRFLLRADRPMPAGQLTVRYVIDTERPDLPTPGPVRASTVTAIVPVRR